MKYPDDLLRGVTKPVRYVGGEYNAARKDPDSAASRVGLVFPETYEIGMSHLGTRILYHALNADPHTCAERAFCPWPDMEAALRERRHPLLSLENGLPLSSFHVLGFSILYELTLSNVLTVLDLSGIPFLSRDRDARHPLVIAGGPAVSNPEPSADFFDMVLLGEGEEAFPEIVLLEREHRGERAVDRTAFFRRFARLEGVYVPSLYPVTAGEKFVFVDAPASVAEGLPFPVRRRRAPDLGTHPLPEKTLVPHTEIVHDRIASEISRGCNQGCRFCHASFFYRPQRERQAGQLLEWITGQAEATGYEEVALSSLSSGSFGGVETLAEILAKELAPRGVALSFPSLRASKISRRLAEAVASFRRTGFTLAPEAGTQRMRDVINKNLAEDDILRGVLTAFHAGWDLVKLYFMVGLPHETEDDVRGIAILVKKILDAVRTDQSGGERRRAFKLNVGLSPFVPKAHTPFQWAAMDDRAVVESKVRLLGSLIRDRAVTLKWQDPASSRLECILSRGDRRVSSAIEHAWRLGARFDGWNETFKPGVWDEALARAGVDPAPFLGAVSPGEHLPWDAFAMAAGAPFLESEWRAAAGATTTPCCGVLEEDGDAGTADVRTRCHSCGAGCATAEMADFRRSNLAFLSERGTRGAAPVAKPPAWRAFRLEMTKTGPAAWMSHLDMIRTVQRIFRRSGVRLRHSEGFHPIPVLGFSPALGVGVGGLRELVDGWVDLPVSGFDAWCTRLNAVSVDGVRFTSVLPRDHDAPSIEKWANRAEYRITFPETSLAAYFGPGGTCGEGVRSALEGRVRALFEAPSWPVERDVKGKRTSKDLRPLCAGGRAVSEQGSWGAAFVAVLGSSGAIRAPEWVQLLLPGYAGPYSAERTRLFREDVRPA